MGNQTNLCTNSRSAGESQKNQNRAKFVKIVIAAQRNKKKTPSIFLQSNTHSREFSITQKSSRPTPPNLSLSPHTANKEALQFPPHRRRSLSLSLSPAPYGGKFKPEWGRVLGIAPPTPLRVSILGIKFDNHRHPKIKYPD
jgi:hypothetical protein